MEFRAFFRTMFVLSVILCIVTGAILAAPLPHVIEQIMLGAGVGLMLVLAFMLVVLLRDARTLFETKWLAVYFFGFTSVIVFVTAISSQ